MSVLNSYYGMAENDFQYAKASLEICKNLGNYNAIATGCAQAGEKYLKALAERCLVGNRDAIYVLKTHNLRMLVNEIKRVLPHVDLNNKDAKWLGDYYYEARYPGENFVEVGEEDAIECLQIVEKIREVVTIELTVIQKKKEAHKLFENMNRLNP